MLTNHKINLIVRSLSGNTSLEEESQLSEWIKTDPENEHFFNQFKKTWQVSASLNDEYNPDTNKAWEGMKIKIESLNPSIPAITPQRRNWLAIAATILAIPVLGVTLIYLFSGDESLPDKLQYVEVGTGDSVNILYLPDSSKVILNKNSWISFAEDLADTARITYLTGEAYFEVRTCDKSFIVFAGETQVTVKGTSFNIKAAENGSDVEVTVVEGKVAFQDQNAIPSSSVTLGKDEKLTFNRNNREYVKGKSSGKNNWWNELNIEKEVQKMINKIKRELK